MYIRIIISYSLLALSFPLKTLADPGPGFKYIGPQHEEKGYSGDSKINKSWDFSADDIDTSYHQTTGTALSGNGAVTNLKLSDLPGGVHLECHGTTGYEKRWAILKPYGDTEMLSGNMGSDLKIKSIKLTLGFYTDAGTAMDHGGANSHCDLWVKTK